MFYGTTDKKGYKAFQGKSILVSHIHENDMTQGTGFFGITNKNQPILNDLIASLPNFYKRNQVGTDIFIMGFNGDQQWKAKLIAAVLENFFVAIYNKKLIVRIDDTIIDYSTMSGLIDRYISDNSLTSGYFKSLSFNNNIKYFYDEDFKGLGRIELYLMKGNDLPKRVAMVRATGMKIEDRGNFRNAAKFSGVFLALGDKINDFLRKCEGPRHDKWIAERYNEDPTYAAEIIRELIRWISDKVKQLVTYDSSKEQDIAGLSKYLADNIPIEKNSNNELNDNSSFDLKPVKTVLKRKEVKPWNEKNSNGQSLNVREGENNISIVKGNSNNNRNGGKQRKILGGSEDSKGIKGSNYNNKGKDTSKEPIPINIKEMRTYYNSTNKKYIVSFIPMQDINKGYFELTIVGDSNEIEHAPVLTAIDKDTGKNATIIQEGDSYRIKVDDIKVNQKVIYEVQLKHNERCALEVDVYEHKMA